MSARGRRDVGIPTALGQDDTLMRRASPAVGPGGCTGPISTYAGEQADLGCAELSQRASFLNSAT